MRFFPSFGRRSSRGSASDDGWLKPQTKQAIAGIVLIVLSLILMFAFFNQAGSVGAALLMGLRRLTGWLAYALPFLLLYIGYRLLRPTSEQLPRWRLVGAGLTIVGLLGIFHIVNVPLDDSLQIAAEGRGGGYLGFMLSYPLSIALSRVVSAVIFVAAFFIGVFMTFNISPAEAWAWLATLLPQSEATSDTEDESEEVDDEEAPALVPRFRISRMSQSPAADPAQLKLDNQVAEREKEQAQARRQQLKAVNKRYKPPPLELLASSTRQPQGGDVEANMETIQRTLAHFDIKVEMGKAKVGPTVTQYTLRPEEGVRLSQITGLQNDLARALAAHPVRIEAPIPNTDLVGIEIPNKEVAIVRLRDLLSAKEFKRSESPLSLALGKDVGGKTVSAELDRMPHLLIAGATNSGKSVSIHAILMSLLYRNSPQLLRLVMVDPKRVELAAYNGIPHLWGEPVIVDTNKTLNALKWALREMDRRYKALEESGSRNLMSYNLQNPDSPLPYIVIIIDELADLMAKHAREVEGPIVRLAQLARAVGIHLILATQRPSVNVITGLIKANVPTRIAFKVASQIDSRTIIDMAGAEKLVGTGDMLYLASDNTKPQRLQGGYVSEDEVRNVVKYIVENNEPVEIEETEATITSQDSGGSFDGGTGDADDPLFEEAKRIAIEARKVSASLLQRRLRVGYARAARLLDMLEEQGVIGAAEGNKPREILVQTEQYGDEDEGDSGEELSSSSSFSEDEHDRW